MKRIISLSLLLIAVLPALAAAYTPEDVPNVQKARRDRYVSNPDGILSPTTVTALDSLLGDIWRVSTAEPVVVVIDSIADGYDENSFANELFDLWKIGKADTDNGLLFLVVKSLHRAVARTGRGTSSVLPDAKCGRIIRTYGVPYFQKDDYDGGVNAVTHEFARVLTDPDAAADIRSEQKQSGDSSSESIFAFVLKASCIGGVAMLIWVLVILLTGYGREEQYQYRRLNDVRPVALFLSFLCLGMALPAYLICVVAMRRIRNHPRSCPNCDTPMCKLDEETDNDYLTPAQDAEERLNSVDYDVWLCPRCGEKDVIPYVNKRSAFTNCVRCGARTCTLAENRIIKQPTTSSEGMGEKVYICHNCRQRTSVPYKIAKVASAPPVIIIPGGGGGGGFGGGIGGGGFGGGGTSGGGASVGW